MKFYDFWKKYKGFILFALSVVVLFLVFLIDNHIEMLQTKKNYEVQIEDLKKLVQVSNIGKTPEKEFDIYQTAEDFLVYYYGVSKDISAKYRSEKLEELMTENAYAEYGQTDYDNTLNYTVTLEDIRIFVDYKNSTKESVFACIFYDENIDWPEVNTITLKKYWLGTLVFDPSLDKWLVSEITDCQELLTREEFNLLNTDTNGSTLENIATEEEGKNADIKKKE